MNFFDGADFGLFIVGLLFSFIISCVCIFIGVKFWALFKKFAKFELKIKRRGKK